MNYIKLEKKNDIQSNKPINKKQFNYGLALLKSFLSFLVLLSHNFDIRTTKNKIIIFMFLHRRFHVPSFFIMSFYFMYNNLLTINSIILFRRLIRILAPYVGWPIIIWIMNNILNIILAKKFPDSFEELKFQLLLGNRFIQPLWFNWMLMLITILFYLIIYVSKNQTIFVFLILLIIFYIFQYSGFAYKNHFKKNPSFNFYPAGFFFESFPFALTGFIFGHYKILEFLKKNKMKTIIISFLIYKTIVDYNIFANLNGVRYQGIQLNIRAICIVFIFAVFPSENITNAHIKKLLISITSNSVVVYYLHVPIHFYFIYLFNDIKKRNFLGMIITYLICYFIGFVGMKIFGKTPLKYLFC